MPRLVSVTVTIFSSATGFQKLGRPAHPFFEDEYELQLEMVRPTTARVVVPPVPDGYLLRQFRPGDEKP
jgi:hypothetical protein